MGTLKHSQGMMGAAIEALRDAERVALAGVGRSLGAAKAEARRQRQAQRARRWSRITATANVTATAASEDEGVPFTRSKEDG